METDRTVLYYIPAEPRETRGIALLSEKKTKLRKEIDYEKKKKLRKEVIYEKRKKLRKRKRNSAAEPRETGGMALLCYTVCCYIIKVLVYYILTKKN